MVTGRNAMRPIFKVGDQVSFKFGLAKFEGTVTEDRGPLGRGGMRIYQILVTQPPIEPTTYEMREDEIECLAAPKKVRLNNPTPNAIS